MDAPYRHIAACVERSPASALALEEARRLRALGPGGLTLVHVAPSPLLLAGEYGAWVPDPADLSQESARWLAELAGTVPGAGTALLEGHPPSSVCAWARGTDVDLLVAASSRGLVDRLMLGSFAGYLVHHSPVSVILVRPAAT
jgi:nucleotide-binding universal stress UspA family protein